MSITPLPTAPLRGNRETFRNDAEVWVSALPTFVTETNALAVQVEEFKDNAETANTEATASAAAALDYKNTTEELVLSTINYIGPWDAVLGAVNIPASCSHNGSIWMALEHIDVAGDEEPGISTKWQEIKATLVFADNATALAGMVADEAINPSNLNYVLTDTLANYEETLDADRKRKITITTSTPTGGSNGDIWLQYTA